MRIPTFIATLALSTCLMAAGDAKGAKKITGCLTKDSQGTYTLTEESGKTVTLMGSADLEKHAANHKVIVHGSQKTENGKITFHVDRIEHVADTCTAPAPR